MSKEPQVPGKLRYKGVEKFISKLGGNAEEAVRKEFNKVQTQLKKPNNSKKDFKKYFFKIMVFSMFTDVSDFSSAFTNLDVCFKERDALDSLFCWWFATDIFPKNIGEFLKYMEMDLTCEDMTKPEKKLAMSAALSALGSMDQDRVNKASKLLIAIVTNNNMDEDILAKAFLVLKRYYAATNTPPSYDVIDKAKSCISEDKALYQAATFLQALLEKSYIADTTEIFRITTEKALVLLEGLKKKCGSSTAPAADSKAKAADDDLITLKYSGLSAEALRLASLFRVLAFSKRDDAQNAETVVSVTHDILKSNTQCNLWVYCYFSEAAKYIMNSKLSQDVRQKFIDICCDAIDFSVDFPPKRSQIYEFPYNILRRISETSPQLIPVEKVSKSTIRNIMNRVTIFADAFPMLMNILTEDEKLLTCLYELVDHFSRNKTQFQYSIHENRDNQDIKHIPKAIIDTILSRVRDTARKKGLLLKILEFSDESAKVGSFFEDEAGICEDLYRELESNSNIAEGKLNLAAYLFSKKSCRIPIDARIDSLIKPKKYTEAVINGLYDIALLYPEKKDNICHILDNSRDALAKGKSISLAQNPPFNSPDQAPEFYFSAPISNIPSADVRPLIDSLKEFYAKDAGDIYQSKKVCISMKVNPRTTEKYSISFTITVINVINSKQTISSLEFFSNDMTFSHSNFSPSINGYKSCSIEVGAIVNSVYSEFPKIKIKVDNDVIEKDLPIYPRYFIDDFVIDSIRLSENWGKTRVQGLYSLCQLTTPDGNIPEKLIERTRRWFGLSPLKIDHDNMHFMSGLFHTSRGVVGILFKYYVDQLDLLLETHATQMGVSNIIMGLTKLAFNQQF